MAQCIGKFYTVQAGDTCWGIAQKHNLTVSDLQLLNLKVNCNNLQIGQQLCVEKMTLLQDFYTIKSGDTCLDISKQNSISEEQLLKYNPGLNCNDLQINQTIYTGPKSAPAAAAGGGTTTTTTTSAPAAAAGGGTTTTTTTSAPGRGGTDIQWAKFMGVMEAGVAANELIKKKEEEIQQLKQQVYKMGGRENVDWIYTNDENDIRCLTNWTYLDAQDKVLQENIPRTTMHNSDRRWCATNTAYIRNQAAKPLVPLAPPAATCVGFDGNYTILKDNHGGGPMNNVSSLNECEGIGSKNGRYKFVLQSDGNAVLYDNNTRSAVWAASDETGKKVAGAEPGRINVGGRPYKMMFDDKNLVIRDANQMDLYTRSLGDRPDGRRIVLNNRGRLNSQASKHGYKFGPDDDLLQSKNCRIKIQSGFETSDNYVKPTKISLKKGEVLFQCDGLISVDGKLILYINDDGRIVIYDDRGDRTKAKTTKTTEDDNEPVFLIYQNDGNLVLYDTNNNALWSWQTPKDGKFILEPYSGDLRFVSLDMPETEDALFDIRKYLIATPTFY